MKSRKRKLLIVGVFITIIACILCWVFVRRVSYAGEKKTEFNGFLNSVSLERNKVRSIQTKIKEEEINWLKNEEDKFTEEEIKEFAEENKKYYQNNVMNFPKDEYDENKVLTYDEAKEDVERLFKLFKYGYGAYGYFGGESKFEEAKKLIINELNGKDKIKCYDLNKIITKNLLFIKDAHFYVSENKITDSNSKKNLYSGYYISSVQFLKDNNGYYTEVNDKRKYVKNIQGDKDIEKYMRYSINEDGKLIYRIVITSEISTEYSRDVSITCLENEKEINENIRLNLSQTALQQEIFLNIL